MCGSIKVLKRRLLIRDVESMIRTVTDLPAGILDVKEDDMVPVQGIVGVGADLVGSSIAGIEVRSMIVLELCRYFG